MKREMEKCILFMFFVFFKFCGGQVCQERWYSSESFVCVCDEASCDVIGDVSMPSSGFYKIVTSSRDQDRFNIQSLPIQPPSGSAIVKIKVNQSATYQTMIGFGGAFTDSAGINIASLSATLQDTLIRSYFASEGIEYNIGRIPIAGCDFSVRPYSYDDVPGDVDLQYFALTEEDYLYKIPYIHKAMNVSRNPVLLFGSPWSPPSWMKENGMFNGTGGLLPQYYQTYADYLIKFIEAYENLSVPIWGLTPQNEPLAGYNDWPWNACGWTGEQMRDWIKFNFGPTLVAANLNHIQFMVHDYNRDTIIIFSTPILEDPEASQYAEGVACHWYADEDIGPDVLDTIHDNFPSKYILYTESCEGSRGDADPVKVDLGSWKRAENYASNIIEDVNHWSTGWVDWNIALDLQGGPNWADNYVDSPVIINQTANEFYKQPMFYVMGHFSKFIPEGSVKLGSSEEDLVPQNSSKLSALRINSAAFAVPNGIAVIVHNREETDLAVVIEDTTGVTYDVTIPAKSINTLLY